MMGHGKRNKKTSNFTLLWNVVLSNPITGASTAKVFNTADEKLTKESFIFATTS